MGKMNLLDIIIETKRLVLKPISYDYADEIFKEFTYEITKYMASKPTENIEETKYFIKESLEGLAEGTNLQLVIIKKDNNEFIGRIGLYNIKTKDPELGIWTKKSSHNNGYGLEAMDGLIEWAHKNIKFSHLRYPVDKRNKASRRLPEKNNGIIMKEYKKIGLSGNELDEYEYWIYPKKSK
jgi:RimJ/RimL family protein N-acetyltransferase